MSLFIRWLWGRLTGRVHLSWRVYKSRVANLQLAHVARSANAAEARRAKEMAKRLKPPRYRQAVNKAALKPPSQPQHQSEPAAPVVAAPATNPREPGQVRPVMTGGQVVIRKAQPTHIGRGDWKVRIRPGYRLSKAQIMEELQHMGTELSRLEAERRKRPYDPDLSETIRRLRIRIDYYVKVETKREQGKNIYHATKNGEPNGEAR